MVGHTTNNVRIAKVVTDGSGITSVVSMSRKPVTADNIDFATLPYGRIYYSTFGSSGGQVFAASSNNVMNFNTLDPDSVDVTSPANGQLQINTSGTYKIAAHARCQEIGQSNQMISIEASTDGGSTWFEIASRGTLFSTDVNRGPLSSTVAYLQSGTRLRVIYNNAGSSPTRVAAANASQQKYTASLVASM